MINSCFKPKVLLLGTFHMRQTPDMYKIELDNLLSSTRQQEIRDVIERLKCFNPTKVAVEAVTERDEALNNEFEAYINGQFELPVNEVYQLGFRIAAELGHEKIYPIDWMEQGLGSRSVGDVYEWAEKNQPELFKEIFDVGLPHTDKSKSILELYQDCNNTLEIKKIHQMYINMARIGHLKEYVGIDWLAWWYQRNLILFSNISRLATSEDERILVIIGSSHIYLLDEFIRESGVIELKDVNELLSADK